MPPTTEGSAFCSARLPETPLKASSQPWSPLRESFSCRTHYVPVPPSPFRDLRSLLVDLGNRQEENFRRLQEQQRDIHQQLVAMQSGVKDNSTHRNQDTVETHLRANGRPDLAEKRVTLMSNWSSANSAKESTFVGAEGVIQCPVAPVAPLINAPVIHQHDIDKTGGSVSKPNTMKRLESNHHGLQLSREWFVSLANGSMAARINHYLKSKEFNAAIAVAIILNAFVICWECQYHGLDVGFNLQFPGRQAQAKVVWPGAESTFNKLDWGFGVLFLTEMVLKLLFWRHKYFYDRVKYDPHSAKPQKGMFRRFWKSLQVWNLLDLCCVVAFLSDKMAVVSAVNPQNLRLLRLFRIFRVVRFLRWLETLDHLYVMMTAVAGLRRVLMWAIVFLTTQLLMCNLFLVQTLHATYFNHVTASVLNEEALRRHHQMYEYFGTCTRCMLSMFEMTLGNWPPVARLLSEEVSQWFTLICVLHKLTIGFAVIGVITGIILQETFKVAQTDDIIMFRQKKRAARTLRRKMQALFDTLDAERDGKLHVSEFTAIGEDPDIQVWLASLDIETDDLATLFSLIDEDGSGYITLDELVSRLPRIQGSARGIDMLAMMKEFQIAARPMFRKTVASHAGSRHMQSKL